jgi:hypothetical protein
VSRYLDQHHVRFSVWNERGEAEAAVSIDERESARLQRFLGVPGSPSLVTQLRLGARKTVERLTRA